MRKVMLLLITAFLFFALTGCSSVSAPVSNGIIYTGVKGPVTATDGEKHSKVGRASCSSILGLVSVGDASISKAIKKGNIDDIHHVDHKSTSVLGLYSNYTTIVYGE